MRIDKKTAAFLLQIIDADALAKLQPDGLKAAAIKKAERALISALASYTTDNRENRAWHTPAELAAHVYDRLKRTEENRGGLRPYRHPEEIRAEEDAHLEATATRLVDIFNL